MRSGERGLDPTWCKGPSTPFPHTLFPTTAWLPWSHSQISSSVATRKQADGIHWNISEKKGCFNSVKSFLVSSFGELQNMASRKGWSIKFKVVLLYCVTSACPECKLCSVKYSWLFRRSNHRRSWSQYGPLWRPCFEVPVGQFGCKMLRLLPSSRSPGGPSRFSLGGVSPHQVPLTPPLSQPHQAWADFNHLNLRENTQSSWGSMQQTTSRTPSFEIPCYLWSRDVLSRSDPLHWSPCRPPFWAMGRLLN